jgi:hypothetical protein
LLLLVAASAQAEHSTILPAPQQITYGAGSLPLSGLPIHIGASATEDDRFAAQTLAACIGQATGTAPAIINTGTKPSISLERSGTLDPLPVPGETPGAQSREAYTLNISTSGAAVKARSSAGVFYGVQTLCQMIEMPAAVLPEAKVTDWPAMAYRGTMVDMSAGRTINITFTTRPRLRSTVFLPRLQVPGSARMMCARLWRMPGLATLMLCLASNSMVTCTTYSGAKSTPRWQTFPTESSSMRRIRRSRP